MAIKKNKKVGIAKKEMAGFDITLEDFDSISIDEFDSDVQADIEAAVQTETEEFIKKSPWEKK